MQRDPIPGNRQVAKWLVLLGALPCHVFAGADQPWLESVDQYWNAPPWLWPTFLACYAFCLWLSRHEKDDGTVGWLFGGFLMGWVLLLPCVVVGFLVGSLID